MADYEDDVERVARDYVDPNATTQSEVRQELEDAGIEGVSNGFFTDRITTVEDVTQAVADGGTRGSLTLREDVEQAASGLDAPDADSRLDTVTRDAARDLGAPSESEVDSARRQVIAQADIEAGGDQSSNTITLRSNGDLDPLGEREIATLSDAERAVGEGGRFEERVDRTGESRGTYKLVDSSGTEYPIAEVDL